MLVAGVNILMPPAGRSGANVLLAVELLPVREPVFLAPPDWVGSAVFGSFPPAVLEPVPEGVGVLPVCFPVSAKQLELIPKGTQVIKHTGC